jgi:hypothetical protein
LRAEQRDSDSPAGVNARGVRGDRQRVVADHAIAAKDRAARKPRRRRRCRAAAAELWWGWVTGGGVKRRADRVAAEGRLLDGEAAARVCRRETRFSQRYMGDDPVRSRSNPNV